MTKIAVLVSRQGSNLEAIIASGIEVSLVIADRDCPALKIAHQAGITTKLLERSFGRSFKRKEYTQKITLLLQSNQINLVVMAGFLTIFSPEIFAVYGGRILNTHPSLLPAFKGNHAVRQALAAGVKITGCTVHITTPVVDSGPILDQESVRILPGDTEESLEERIKAVERILYPQTIKNFLTEPQN